MLVHSSPRHRIVHPSPHPASIGVTDHIAFDCCGTTELNSLIAVIIHVVIAYVRTDHHVVLIDRGQRPLTVLQLPDL